MKFILDVVTMKKRICCLLISLLIVLSLAGCATAIPNAAEGFPGEPAEEYAEKPPEQYQSETPLPDPQPDDPADDLQSLLNDAPAATYTLTVREGVEFDEVWRPAGVTAENIIFTGSDVKSVEVRAGPDAYVVDLYFFGDASYWVELTLYESARQAFAEATYRLVGGYISFWIDDYMVSAPRVNAYITDGVVAVVAGDFDLESAMLLAYIIRGGTP